MKSSAAVCGVKVSADGHGVVSHAGVGMLRELAELTGLSSQVTAALADTYRGPWTHAPGQVFAVLAAAVADGADCVDGVGQLWGDRGQAFGRVASTSTLWRCVDERIDATRLPGSGRRGHTPANRLGPRGRHPITMAGCIWMSMPPSSSIIPITRRTPRRPRNTLSACTRCWCFWTVLTSPPARRWPGCCDPGMREVTPPPTTSPCWAGRWIRCRGGIARGPATRMHHRS